MKYCAVIVTFNRIEKLKKCLKCFDNLSIYPDQVVVVNNASTDNTKEYLDEWKDIESNFKKIVINNKENLGGSGGFYTGLEYSLDSGCDWVWVSDDDAYPDKDVFKVADEFLDKHKDENISAICGEVITNNKIDLAHRRTRYIDGLKIKAAKHSEEEYKKECFEINEFSYVGSIININKLKEVGLTEKDYFIWADDSEHSLRLSKAGIIYCVPKIIIEHDQDVDTVKFSWKSYYGTRNLIDLQRRHFKGAGYYLYITKQFIKLVWLWMFEKNRDHVAVHKASLFDGINGRLGKHPIYKPGWKPL